MARRRWGSLARPGLLVAVLGAAVSPAAGQDPVKVDPEHYQLEFENDDVRVLRVTYGPGEKSPMHRHRPHVVVFLTGGQFRFSVPSGTTIESPAGEPGDAGWADTDLIHAPENTGSARAELVLVEVKRTGSPAFKPAALDPVKLNPARFTVVLENEHVRVLRNKVAAGQPGVVHEHPSTVVVRISGGPGNEQPPAVSWEQGPLKHGDPGRKAPAGGEVVIVELKSGAGSKPVS